MDTTAREEQILSLLKEVKDPELPMVDIVGLGMVRSVEVDGDSITIVITPTYMGCPAMKSIEDDVLKVLEAAGIDHVKLKKVYAPAWSSEWISEDTRAKLKEMGIAPPLAGQTTAQLLIDGGSDNIACPFCDSTNTELRSAFGSTSCKALYYCQECHQPFEYFKCH